ncbi:hypothetical protein GGTG_14038 [Gaeumannomyces tritici R3-111a-1]|uniref:Transmembrane protein n=1 Tax=Gaeumannomyces tritici (strain R3-111a-1) TaxID=644352 RepID=J3PKI3_GAET3|nr:hypothetical protein GGTG_14038 [Gaeumannomyces tritici R3-111a-1]EJT68383.1 hypothetical protein GGTG_14038 [Gaeumannomyces tritici R3-111a-1]
MADTPTFSPTREPAAARLRELEALQKELHTRIAFFVVLSALPLASFSMVAMSLLSLKTTAAGEARKGGLDRDGSPTLWLLCLVVTTTLTSVAAAAMMENLVKPRARDWWGMSLLMAAVFVCAILVLPVHLAVSAYWGEALGRACIFFMSVLFCLTAIRLGSRTARETQQPAADMNLEER